MFWNYVKLTLRSLLKNRTFVLINVLGLGMAIACCIVAFLNWDFNKQFDAYHADTDNVYRINFTRVVNDRTIQNGSCPIPLGAQVESALPQIEDVMRYFPFGGNFKIQNDLIRTNVAAVDPAFFDHFTFEMLQGSAEGIEDRKSILISSVLKDKYFRDVDNPVGEVLTYVNGENQSDYKVAGVFLKPPLNNSFSQEAFVHYDNIVEFFNIKPDDWSRFNTTFIKLNQADDVGEVERQLQNYVAIQNERKADYKVSAYYLDPFEGMAQRAESEDIWNHWMQQSLPIPAVISPGIMAILILLIACFNFTNTSIAIANRRIKEIGIRKVLGSNRNQLLVQFLGENTLMAFLGLLAGLLLAAILVPAYSALWPFLDIELNLLKDSVLIGFLAMLLLFTALVAGIYPALYVSSFNPTSIFRGNLKFSGTNPITRTLLVFQFSISLMAIISGLVFSQNAKFQKDFDMGFDQYGIIYAQVGDGLDYAKLRNALTGNNQFKQIAGSTHNVGSSWYTDPVKYEEFETDVNILNVGDGYLETIGATLLNGRDFRANSRSDIDMSVIVNEEFVKTFNMNAPIDQRLILRDTVALNVIGVVKDIYFEGALWDPLEPMMLRMTPESSYRFLSVRTDVDELLEAKTFMDNAWKQIFPNSLSTVTFMEEARADSLLVNKNIEVLFIFLGILAVILSSIGMFSLVSLNLTKRMKEIGVRKVLGASAGNISIKVSREFIVILVISSILGSITAYYLTQLLLASIWAYYAPLSAMVFVLSIVLIFVISAVTIGGQVFKASSVNPANILRSE